MSAGYKEPPNVPPVGSSKGKGVVCIFDKRSLERVLA